MKLSKKIMAAVLTTVVAASSLVGCKNGETSSTSKVSEQTQATTTKSQEVTTSEVQEVTTSEVQEVTTSETQEEAISEQNIDSGTGNEGDNNSAVQDIKEVGEIPEETVTINIFSQLSSCPGEVQGWSRKLFLDKFNVKLNIIADMNGAYEVLSQEGNLGDIVVFGSNGGKYLDAIENGYLLDLEKNDLINKYGAQLAENAKIALEANKSLSPDGKLYGFGYNFASSIEDHETPFYTWDIRWDLYQQLNYPEVKDLDDYVALFESMKELYPVDENGNETYAVSLWPDWDGAMAMNVKATATAYYGYDEQGMGLYDVETGEYYDALEKDGPYLEILKYYNTLYQKGLLDPESRNQDYTSMSDKVSEGRIFSSIFDYAGRYIYNNVEHIEQNKLMAPLVPDEGTPIAYGLDLCGGNRVWTIGAKTKYPNLCMSIINYLATPEGCLEYNYGPQSVEATPDATDGCWYYKDGKTYFTDLGKKCFCEDRTTLMPVELGGMTFGDGFIFINATTWSFSATNPTTGEKYDYKDWKSMQSDPVNDLEKDWREFVNKKNESAEDNLIMNAEDYLDSRKLSDGTSALKISIALPQDDYNQINSYEDNMDLRESWGEVSKTLVEGSWDAIYAKTDAEFEQIVSKMIEDCNAAGYEECVKWSEESAAARKKLEDSIRAEGNEE